MTRTEYHVGLSEPITIAAFTKLSEAEEAVRKLIDGGVSADELSILAKDIGHRYGAIGRRAAEA